MIFQVEIAEMKCPASGCNSLPREERAGCLIAMVCVASNLIKLLFILYCVLAFDLIIQTEVNKVSKFLSQVFLHTLPAHKHPIL